MRTLHLERLLGREVLTANNRRLGRLEEFRAERQATTWVVSDFVIGRTGLFERLGLGARLVIGVGGRGGYLVHWDQLDLSNPERPRVTCAVDELKKL